MTNSAENRAIELYYEDELPHDRPWSELSESTRDGYRQRVHREKENEHRHAS